MRKMPALTAIFLLLCATGAQGRTLTADGSTLEPSHGYTTQRDLPWLVNDGSFEGGDCITAPIWTCTTDNGCEWITDLVPLGLWNYDGNHVAWLGGYCGGIATEFTSICQVVQAGYCPPGHIWHWMAYINGDGGSRVFVTADGDVVFEKILAPEDHLLDYQYEYYEDWGIGYEVELCFHYDRNGAEGDNYFVDYVEEWMGPTASEPISFSTIKSLY